MNEIYWLTRVGTISNIGYVMLVLSIVALVTVPLWIDMMGLEEREGFNLKTAIKSIFATGIIGLIIVAFVPTKQDMYLIYGLGSVVEYVQGNDKAKEIPDKAVEAIIEWMDLKKEDEK